MYWANPATGKHLLPHKMETEWSCQSEEQLNHSTKLLETTEFSWKLDFSGECHFRVSIHECTNLLHAVSQHRCLRKEWEKKKVVRFPCSGKGFWSFFWSSFCLYPESVTLKPFQQAKEAVESKPQSAQTCTTSAWKKGTHSESTSLTSLICY